MIRRSIAASFAVLSAVFLIKAFIEPFAIATLTLNLPKFIPTMFHERITGWTIEQTGFAIGPQYLLRVIKEIYKTQSFLGVAVFIFSVITPFVKILLCLFEAISPSRNNVGAHVVSMVAKWSMADVFIIALVVVFFKAEHLVYKIQPASGFWFFFVSVVLSMISAELLTNRYFDNILDK